MSEEDLLEEWGIKQINDYETTLKPGANDLKRTKRFSGELSFNPEPYYEFLDMARSQDLSGKEIINVLRGIEDNMLGQSTSLSRTQMFGNVIHHIKAQRTGGNTLRRLAQSQRSEARKILREGFGGSGNVPPNLYSMWRSWHTKQDKAKGLEARALQELGFPPEKAGLLPTIKAHQSSPSSSAVSGEAPGTTAAEVVPILASQMERQQAETFAALEQMEPLQQDVDTLVRKFGPADMDLDYHPGMTTEELSLRKAIIDANPDEAVDILKKHLVTYVEGADQGLRLNAADPLSPLIKAVLENPTGATIGALLEGYNMETIKKVEAGDIGGAAMDIGKGTVIGAAAETVLSKAPLSIQRGVARLSPALMGKALIEQGRENSPTSYLLKTYGEKVGMTQERPFWGTEIGEMQTEKPEYVQATEQALDWIGEKTIQFGKGVAKFVFGGIQQKQQERQQAEKSNLPYLPNIR